VSALGISVQPSSTANAEVVFATQPAVAALDAFGNTNTAYATAINAAQTSGGNLNGAAANSVAGTLASGVATFSGLYVTNSGNTTLTFSSGALPTTNSANINVSGGTVTKLVWTTQPANATNRIVFGTSPVLKTADRFGNVSTFGLTTTQNVYVALSAGTGRWWARPITTSARAPAAVTVSSPSEIS